MTNFPRLMVAAPASGSGKTTVTLALMAAFVQRGKRVQGFKVGPDYIDPTYHRSVTGRPARNLDTWMTPQDHVRKLFAQGAADADLSIVEGVMGLYDGKSPLTNEGSSAEVAKLLRIPVLLVIDASGMARSSAAMVKGFQALDPDVQIAGVIANRVGSEGHYRLIEAAVLQECGIPVVGYLERQAEALIPERHLGLVPSFENPQVTAIAAQLAELALQTVRLDDIERIALAADPLENAQSLVTPAATAHARQNVRIGYAFDAAFHFYYEENLELLKSAGAELVPFSPLAGEVPSEVSALYIGGGFPETFAKELSAQQELMQRIRGFHQSGMPVYAECGGLMYLSRSISDLSGSVYPMAGLLPTHVNMQQRLQSFGYREVEALCDTVLCTKGTVLRGHEFHFSAQDPAFDADKHPYRFALKDRTVSDGFTERNLLASYIHIHFGSCPEVAVRFVEQASRYGQQPG